MHTSLFS
jgi:serine/threonine protein kinase